MYKRFIIVSSIPNRLGGYFGCGDSPRKAFDEWRKAGGRMTELQNGSRVQARIKFYRFDSSVEFNTNTRDDINLRNISDCTEARAFVCGDGSVAWWNCDVEIIEPTSKDGLMSGTGVHKETRKWKNVEVVQ